MQEESFGSRYTVKILSSVFIAALNFVIQIILPRALSIEEFGYYSYNLNIFLSTVTLANLSTSNALVAKFAKRNDEIGIVFFYLKYYAIETVLLSAGVVILYKFQFLQSTFIGQTVLMVLLGLEVNIVSKFLTDVVSVYDALAITKVSAIFQIVLKVLMCIVVVLSYAFGRLNLIIFYLCQIVITLLIVGVLLKIVLKYQKELYAYKSRSNIEYFREYIVFCKPLVVSNIVTQLLVIFMNWCLMNFSGVTEQAMFGAAWQLNALINYVFSSYAELSKREYSIICRDKEKLKKFYDSSLRRMIWLTAYFACFIGFCSDWILAIIYGDRYSGANFVTLLIMIYTVYQSWGQMSGAFMLATERTKLSAILGILGQVITIILVFIFQIPNPIWPKSLGSVGIALVYMIGNFLSVCISVGVTSKILNMGIIKELRIQVLPILLCSGTAFILNRMLNIMIVNVEIGSLLIKILTAGFIYTIIIISVLLLKPSLVGLSKESVNKLFIKE